MIKVFIFNKQEHIMLYCTKTKVYAILHLDKIKTLKYKPKFIEMKYVLADLLKEINVTHVGTFENFGAFQRKLKILFPEYMI